MSKKPIDYEALKKIWYKKLKKKGFHDIENEVGLLKTWSSRFSEKRVIELREEREPYYEMTVLFLNEYQFKNALEKTIWEYHSQGYSVRIIPGLIKKERPWLHKTDRMSAWEVIKNLTTIMKKMYMPSQQDNV